MARIDRIADRTARVLALLGSTGLLAMLLHVTADVLARNLLGRPIPATNEIVSHYYMVLIAFLPLAWVEQSRAMVTVELLEPREGTRLRTLSDRLVAALSTIVYGSIAIVTWSDALRAFRVGSFVDVLGYAVPMWPTYFLPPAGFLLASLVTLRRVFAPATGALRP